MRIVVFSWKDIYHDFAGGSEVNIHEQAKRWAARGHRVTMVTSRPKGSLFRDSIDGVDIYRAGGRFTVYLFAPLVYLALLRKQTDVILDIINGIPFFTPIFSRKPKVGLIHHVHQDMFLVELGQVLGRFGKSVERFVVPLLYRDVPIICVSQSTAQCVEDVFYRGERIDVTVIHNGIDQSFYSMDGYRKFDKPTVLYLGRLKKYKRLPKLISLITEARKKVPDAELLIVGVGDAIGEAEEEIRRLGADEFVHMLGYVSDDEKARLYRQAWVTATASMVEGWGLTVIEANACGTPSLAFNVPGLNESIVHGSTGMLASDDNEFVRYLVDVLQNQDLRGELSQECQTWSHTFSWDETAEKTLRMFERVTDNYSP
jgi:glycosyltransferase involved in cell wall biosynthesis